MNATITITLDEDYPLRLEDKYGYLREERLEIPVWGEVTITYRASDDWWVKAIELGASNGASGPQCDSWDHEIYASHPMWKPIEKYLQQIRGEEISSLIREDIEARIDSYLFDEGKERAKFREAAE